MKPGPALPEELDERVEPFVRGRFGAAVAEVAKTKKANLRAAA